MIEIPQPVCKICGKDIPRKGNEAIGHWTRRKACWDNTDCRKQSMMRSVAASRERNPDWWRKQSALNSDVYRSTRAPGAGRKKFKDPEDSFDVLIFKPWVPKRKPMPAAERAKRDAEQRSIDREVEARAWARTGMKPDTGRSLSAEEIKAIQGEITHISQIPFTRTTETISCLYRDVW